MAEGKFWDTEELIDTVHETEKVKHDVSRCTKNGKEFIVATKYVLKKTGWTFAKNQSFEAGVFNAIAALVREDN